MRVFLVIFLLIVLGSCGTKNPRYRNVFSPADTIVVTDTIPCFPPGHCK